MADKPKFDPSKPFTVVGDVSVNKPKFDPSKPYEPVNETKLEPWQSNVINEPANLEGRFAVKNFGGTTQDQIDYLKQKNPNYDIQEINGEIVAKAPGEAQYKKLDPGAIQQNGFNFSFDPKGLELADITDVAYDIPAGVAQTLATGAAGAAAAPTGIGAMPAAMAAGGATGGALEALRQKIGQSIGVSKEYDPTSIGINTAVGAASPLLFGTGASGAQVAKALSNPSNVAKVLDKYSLGYLEKGAAPSLTQKQLANEAVTNAQKSIFSGTGSKVSSAMTGLPSKVIENANNEVSPTLIRQLSNAYEIDPSKKFTNLQFADVIKNQGEAGLGRAARETVLDTLESNRADISRQIESAIASSDKTVDVEKYLPTLVEYQKSLAETAKNNPSEILIDEAKRVKDIIKFISPKERTLSPTGVLDSNGNPIMSFVDTKASFKDMSPVDAFRFKNKLEELIGGYKNPLQTDKMLAPSKELAGKLIDIKKGINSELDTIINEQADANLRGQYRANRDEFRELYNKFKTDDSAIKTIENLDTMRSPTLRNRILDLDNKYGTDITGLSDLAATYKHFGDASLMPKSGGTTSTSRTGVGAIGGLAAGRLGGLLTGIPGAQEVGGAIGLGLGTAATSPLVTKQVLKGKNLLNQLISAPSRIPATKSIIDQINNRVSQLPAAVQPAITKQSGINAIWNMMNNGGQK